VLSPPGTDAPNGQEGKVVDVKGYRPEVERVSKVLETYENANNIGELGIGTKPYDSPCPFTKDPKRRRQNWHRHFAWAENNDILERHTLVEIHWICCMNQATVELDAMVVHESRKVSNFKPWF